MGESGKLLNPDKAVLMPDASADCPMAHMVTKAEIDDEGHAMRTLQLYAISTRLLRSNHGQMYASPQRMQCRL